MLKVKQRLMNLNVQDFSSAADFCNEFRKTDRTIFGVAYEVVSLYLEQEKLQQAIENRLSSFVDNAERYLTEGQRQSIGKDWKKVLGDWAKLSVLISTTFGGNRFVDPSAEIYVKDNLDFVEQLYNCFSGFKAKANLFFRFDQLITLKYHTGYVWTKAIDRAGKSHYYWTQLQRMIYFANHCAGSPFSAIDDGGVYLYLAEEAQKGEVDREAIKEAAGYPVANDDDDDSEEVQVQIKLARVAERIMGSSPFTRAAIAKIWKATNGPLMKWFANVFGTFEMYLPQSNFIKPSILGYLR